MPLVRVRALEDFAHRGASYHTGELVDLPPVDAIVLHRRRKVTLTRALAIDPPREPEIRAQQTGDTSEDEASSRPRRRRARKADADDPQQ